MTPSAIYRTLVLALTLYGCSSTNSLFCDESTKCESQQRSFCSIESNECITPLPDTCNRVEPCTGTDKPYCDDIASGAQGACVECTEASHCLSEQVCSANRCVACAQNSDCEGDSLCDQSSSACIPFSCTPSPEVEPLCVEIDASSPFCGDDGVSCRGCLANAECSSGICAKDTALCVASEDIIHIAKSGSSEADCGTLELPCITVQAGLDLVSSVRFHMLIATGTYSEQLSIANQTVVIAESGTVTIEPTVTNNLPVLSLVGFAAATIEGVDLRVIPINSSPAVEVIRCTGSDATLTIENLTISGATGSGISSTGCSVHGSNLRVVGNQGSGIEIRAEGTLSLKDSTVSGNGQSGVLGSAATLNVTGSTMAENGLSGVEIFEGSLTLLGSTMTRNTRFGISVANSDFTITNNFVIDNGASGEIISGGISISNTDALSPQQMNFNTVAANRATGSFVSATNLSCNSNSPTTGHSNIVFQVFPEDGKPNVQLNNCSLDYSDVEGGTPGIGNKNELPRFINPISGPNGDYHLQQNSPCRDIADPNATLDTDIDGDDRPQGARHDMGADEILPL